MKGILELINEAPVVEYDATRGVTMEETGEWFVALSKIKPVLTSLTVHEIIKQRESTITT